MSRFQWQRIQEENDWSKFINKPQPIIAVPKVNTEEKLPIKESQKTRLRRKIYEEQNGICGYCLTKLEHFDLMTLDHIKPKSKGGTMARENLIGVCFNCNQLKRNFYSLNEVKAYCKKLVDFFSSLNDRGFIPKE